MAPKKKPAASAPKAPAKAKVFWTTDEKKMLVERCAFLISSAAAGSPLQALQMAQSEMPESRRRAVYQVGKTSMPWFHPELSAELKKLHQKAQEPRIAEEPAATVAQPTPEPAAEPSPLNGHAVESVSTLPHNLGEAFLNLRAMLVDELASVIVEAALKAIGSTQFGEQQVRLTETPDSGQRRIVFQRTPTVRKPGILVVGLKGNQKTEIQRDYGARFDLRFVGSDESKDQLRAMSEKAETTIVMTDFISHSHEDIVKARSPNYVRQPGGLTALRSTLAGLTPS